MKNVLAIVLSIVLSGAVMAGDSGLYFSEETSGEGINVILHNDHVVLFYFTYGGEDQEVSVPIPPYVSPAVILDEPLNGQRWFFISGDPIEDGVAVGDLYQGAGINFPQLLPPNGAGNVVVVGEYILEAEGDGWRLSVAPSVDSQLADDDPLFGSHLFRTLLFPATQ